MIGFKSPFRYITVDLGTNSGIGDLSINVSYFFEQKNSKWMITGGAKIPTGNANDKEGGKPLPMPYQTTLGTFDLLAGIGFWKGAWQFSLGYQKVLGNNENGFLHSSWGGNEDAEGYFESKVLGRGDDIIARVEKSWKKESYTIHFGVVGMWRLHKDDYVNEEGIRRDYKDSNTPTININFTYLRSLSENWQFRFNWGNPVVWRPERPDGLTRPFVLTLGLGYKF
ncbi:MAG: hypothetical protein ABEH43_06470 [Flavobacteriales bacterium]